MALMTEQNVNAVRECPEADLLRRSLQGNKADKPAQPGKIRKASNRLVAFCLLYW